LSQVGFQLTYFYQGPNYTWQVTVNPVDVLDAKPTWTAPLYEGGGLGYVTAFSVVNMSANPQSVTVTLTDTSGNVVEYPYVTPMLAGGCACDSYGLSAAGGFFAQTVSNSYGNITQNGTIVFTANAPIIVLVLRLIETSMGSVPAL
jgi:hypothetical protein